ncbi:MAG TPA: leucine-rich repeat domain-containing protein, partial [Candidatus Hydrogenedentes bacterium]|nr:leucine-rich repeat domain-containing protein [Candidatus Hydrogenedentota bacterium]
QALTAAFLALMITVSAANAADVTFNDAILEQAIRAVFTDNGWTLSTPPQDTELSRPEFTQLDASELGITDLTGLEACTSLEELNLARNQISDLTPLSGLTSLIWLDLGKGVGFFDDDDDPEPVLTGLNLVADISPLAGLTNLEYLSLMGNDLLTDISPIAAMSSLAELNLSANPIADFSPLSARAASLEFLLISGCGVQDSDMATFNTLTTIQALIFIAEPNVTDISGLSALNPGIAFGLWSVPGLTDVSVISNFTGLEEFVVIAGTGITAVPDLSGLTNLAELELMYNPLLTDIAGLAGMANIQSLDFRECAIADISVLEGLTTLRRLDLGDNQVTDIQALVDNPGLGGDDHVVLLNNPLSQDAACNQLPALRAKFNNPNDVESNAVCGDAIILTINVVGVGTTWPSPGTHAYTEGELVWIGADTVAGSGYAFSHWEGDVSGTNPNTSVTMNGDRTVTAVFVTPGDHTLTMIKNGGGGDFMRPEAGVHAALAGRTVFLSANPGSGRYWGGWSGDVTGYNLNSQIFMDGDKTVTGTFTTSGYTLTTTVNGNGNLNFGPGTYRLASGAVVMLQAFPNFGWAFDHWEGDVPPGSENDNPLDVTMDQDRAIMAVFVEGSRALTISVGGSGSGTTDPAPGTYNYFEGSSACVTAIPDPGSSFAGWTGDLGGGPWNEPNICVMMNQDRSITANFEPADWNLTIQVSGNGATWPNPGTYGYVNGIQAGVSANLVDGGDAFDQWS